jgi:predicted nucleic acid-binding protein
MGGLTLDSGALIAFERADRGVMTHLKEAWRRGIDLIIPAVVVAEVWRGGRRSARVAQLLAACVVEPIGESAARAAGEALQKLPRAAVVDALVMASASRRGDAVLTSDPDALGVLATVFPGVRVIRV